MSKVSSPEEVRNALIGIPPFFNCSQCRKQRCFSSRRNGTEFLIACAAGDLSEIQKRIINAEGSYDEALVIASATGQLGLVESLIERGASDLDRAYIAAKARKHEDIMALLTKNGATDIDEELIRAVEKGQLDLVESLVERGAAYDYFIAAEAERKGHIDVANFLLYGDPSVDLVRDCVEGRIECEKALVIACERSRYATADSIFNLKARMKQIDRLVASAANENSLRLAYWLIATNRVKLDRAFDIVCQEGNLNMAANIRRMSGIDDLLVARGGCHPRSAEWKNNLDSALVAACRGGHLPVVMWLIREGATDTVGAIVTAAKYDNLPVVKWLATQYPKLINDAFVAACEVGRLDIAQMLADMGPVDASEGLKAAHNGEKARVTQWLLKEFSSRELGYSRC